MNETTEFSTNPEEEISPEQIRAIIQDVIDGAYKLFDVKTMADYDAEFSGEEPLFINIWNKKEGHNFGYIVFHDFLRKVGQDNTFLSTDLTSPGKKLFEKAIQDSLIEKMTENIGLHRMTRYKVINDPNKNLEKIKNQII